MNNNLLVVAFVALALGAVGWAAATFGFAFSQGVAFLIAIFVTAVAWILLWMGFSDDRRGQGIDAKAAPKPAAPAAKPAASAAPKTAAPAAAAPSTPEPSPAPEKAPPPAAPMPEPTPAPEPAPEPVATPQPAAAAPAGDADKPAMLSAAREGGPDDLKKIKGVGPKLEQLLHSMGIFHFDQVAGWTDKEIAWVDENLEGFKGRVTRDNWVAQAKTLAAGGETEFSSRS